MNPLVFGGVAATACAFMLKNQRPLTRSHDSMSACASARVVESVSARAMDTVQDDSVDVVEGSPYDNSLWGLSEEGMDQMTKATVPKVGDNSDRVKLAKEYVRPSFVESLGTKGIGRTVPVIGRDMMPSSQPKVSGGCMFYMSDRYTQALEKQ